MHRKRPCLHNILPQPSKHKLIQDVSKAAVTISGSSVSSSLRTDQFTYALYENLGPCNGRSCTYAWCVSWVAEVVAPCGNVVSLLHSELRGDKAGSLFKSSLTYGCNSVILGLFYIRVGVSLSITITLILPRILEICFSIPSNCFGMNDTRRFSETSALSTHRFFLSPGTNSNIRILFNHSCLIDFLSSRILVNLSFDETRTLHFNNLLSSACTLYGLCSIR